MTPGETLSPALSVMRIASTIDAEIDGEVIVLSIDQGMVFGLGSVGSRIWQLIDRSIRIDDLCATLVREFDVAPAECRTQVDEFLAELQKEGLIEVSPG